MYVCVHTLSDRKAAPASETQGAQASVSDASLIRVEAFISASPSMDSHSVCQVSLGSADRTWHPVPELAYLAVESAKWQTLLTLLPPKGKLFLSFYILSFFLLMFPLIMNFVFIVPYCSFVGSLDLRSCDLFHKL